MSLPQTKLSPVDRNQFINQMEKAESAGDISTDAVRRFWNWAYKDEDGLVQTCAFPVPTEDKDPDEMGSGKWVHATTYETFLDFCTKYSGMWRYHIYSGVNTLDETPKGGRGKASHINKVNHLSFDIETKRDSYSGASKDEVWWCYRYALAQSRFMNEEYGVWPLMVMSENGIHMHFKVDFEVTEDKLHEKSHIYTKYITKQSMECEYVERVKESAPDSVEFGQDDVSDIPRVMKVPGTRGIKSEDGRLCGIIHEPDPSEAGVIKSEQVDVPDGMFAKAPRSDGGDAQPVEPVEVTPDDATPDIMTRIKSLCKKDGLFNRLFEGDVSDYDSRSEAEFAFSMKLLNHGFTADEINQVMWASGMSKWQEESDHYRERTIQKACEKFDGNTVKDSTNGSFSFSRRT